MDTIGEKTDPTGLGLRFGTEEDGRSWIGRRLERRAEVPVNEAMIRNYCALVEDANPDYWEEGISPPGLLMAWLMPAPWRPSENHRRTGIIAMDVPLPGRHLINVSTETEFFGPLQVGAHVHAIDEVTEISPEKRTRLGLGHFITSCTLYTNQSGREVARNTNLILRYDTDNGPATPAGSDLTDLTIEADLAAMLAETRPAPPWQAVTRPAHPRSPAPGDELPAVILPITYQRVILNAAATWDWFPGHHNPFYARKQGQRTIYLSTLFFHGLVDRFVTDWSGPGACIRHRTISMRQSIYAGQTAIVRGHVTEVRNVNGKQLVDIEAGIFAQDPLHTEANGKNRENSSETLCVPCTVTVELKKT